MTPTTLNQPLDQALNPTRRRIVPTLLILLGLLVSGGTAVYGYLQQQRTERILITARPLHYGQQIMAADLAMIEVPRYRPTPIGGIVDPQEVIGKWAATNVVVDTLLQPALLLGQSPNQPVYLSGEVLGAGMTVLLFDTRTVGPLTHTDRVNLGFLDATGDPLRCTTAAGVENSGVGRNVVNRSDSPFSCRLLTEVAVLDVDAAKNIAYLEVTPAQAQAVRAILAAGLPLWGERYGAASPPLAPLDRTAANTITVEQISKVMSDTQSLAPSSDQSADPVPPSQADGRSTRPGGTEQQP